MPFFLPTLERGGGNTKKKEKNDNTQHTKSHFTRSTRQLYVGSVRIVCYGTEAFFAIHSLHKNPSKKTKTKNKNITTQPSLIRRVGEKRAKAGAKTFVYTTIIPIGLPPPLGLLRSTSRRPTQNPRQHKSCMNDKRTNTSVHIMLYSIYHPRSATQPLEK